MKIVIPARYGSSRLPGKPLADIADKPMIQHVWERAKEAAHDGDEVVIAADDDRILEAAKAFGATAVKTRDTHESGTDRIAEVAEIMGWDVGEIVVNVQGDEPLMPPVLARTVGELLAADDYADIATASCAIKRTEDVLNPNIVKVVTDNHGIAMYFSRSPIPYNRDGDIDVETFNYQRHIGLYAYRVGVLKGLTSMPQGRTEKLEQLEQLRAMEAGMKIAVAEIAEAPPHGVDTQADLDVVRKHFEAQG